MSGLSSEHQMSETSPVGRKVRLISYAWGDKYVGELLSLTLPAALAPNNLPAVAKLASAEVVLLIQREHYDRVANHPTILRMREICPVHLVGLDDLIVSKEKYGMSLTYVLHRGVCAFDADVTETYFLFLNADFIIADGSLRNALSRLMQGDRLIAAPSYCVTSHSMRPALRSSVRRDDGAIVISPRPLARLALDHLHNTVRGKTLNQTNFHLAQMDQFYWRVDKDTLLGHQMPVAIVGMQPERAIDEPNSNWDHGVISEYCPEASPRVLGDSDEFLMVELRERAVAAEQLVKGPPDPRKVAECMIGWVTPYQRSFAEYPLTLHAEDLSSVVPAERTKLAERVAEILSHAPKFPSHRDHPQWNYHYTSFMEARHRRLSAELGRATAVGAPPSNLTPIDQAWWRLDGAKKRALRRSAAPDLRSDECVFAEPFFQVRLPSRGLAATRETPAYVGQLREDATKERSRQIRDSLSSNVETAFGNAPLEEREPTIESDIAALEASYTKLVRKNVTSAVIPLVRTLHHEDDHLQQDGCVTRLLRFGRRLRHHARLFGYQSNLRHARTAIAQAVAAGVRDMFVITGDLNLVEELMPRLERPYTVVSNLGVRSGNLHRSLEPGPKFDFCLWELSPDDLLNLRERVAAIRSYLRPEARIVGFCAMDRGIEQLKLDEEAWNDVIPETHVERASHMITILHRGWRALVAHGFLRAAALTVRRVKVVVQAHEPAVVWRRVARPPVAVTVIIQPAVAPPQTETTSTYARPDRQFVHRLGRISV
jgi:hypothetical protein